MAKYLETIFPTNGIVGGLPIKIKHDYRAYAKLIYTAGYRKASDVAEEIFAEIDRNISFYFPATSFVNAPNITHDSLIAMLAEPKKKYTQDKGRDKISEFGKYSPLSWRNTEEGE